MEALLASCIGDQGRLKWLRSMLFENEFFGKINIDQSSPGLYIAAAYQCIQEINLNGSLRKNTLVVFDMEVLR